MSVREIRWKARTPKPQGARHPEVVFALLKGHGPSSRDLHGGGQSGQCVGGEVAAPAPEEEAFEAVALERAALRREALDVAAVEPEVRVQRVPAQRLEARRLQVDHRLVERVRVEDALGRLV